jgi:hypothetical protein
VLNSLTNLILDSLILRYRGDFFRRYAVYRVEDVKPVWVVWQNTDLTEGKGWERVLHVCEGKETAERLGKGRNVQGTDCLVSEGLAYKIEGMLDWYIPGYIIPETHSDTAKRILREEKERVLEKARGVLTEEEISLLTK